MSADLETRVKNLEKQLRLWRLLTLLALILCILIPLGWGAVEDQSLETRSFVLVDAQGHHRAVLSGSADGSPSLVFYDKDGKIVSLLAARPDGNSELDLYGSDGKLLFKAPQP